MILLTLPYIVLWIVIVLQEQRRNGVAWRHGIVTATVVMGVLTTVFIEVLSFAGILGAPSLTTCWLLSCACAITFLLKTGGLSGLELNPLRHWTQGPGACLLAICAVILFLVGVTAVVAPPMTSDAMVYHMTKVFFWYQNKSVDLFPTGNFQQLLAPGAEYQILHWNFLLGSDQFSNLAQWTGLALSAICASLISKQLGGGAMAQCYSSLFVLTIPSGILQASGAKNDFVMTGWLLASGYWIILFRYRPDLLGSLAIGASIGLAVLTKSTIAPFLPALALATLWAAYSAWRSAGATARGVGQLVLVAFAVSLILNAPQLRRNYAVFHNLWGRSEIEAGSPCQHLNKKLGLGVVWSNAVRNVALHLSTPSASWNEAILKQAHRLIEIAGQSPNDPATTWCGTSFGLSPPRRHEIVAGNTFHLVSLTGVLLILLFKASARRQFVHALAYSGLGLLSFVIFCGLLQWQPWHTRFHVAYFAAFAPIVGLVLGSAVPAAFAGSLAGFWILYAGPYVLLNESRPLAGPDSILARDRADMRFTDRSYHKVPFLKAAEVAVLSGCNRIGLANITDGYDYPMMTALQQLRPDVRIKYMNPLAETTRFEQQSTKWSPCAVVCIGCGNKPDTWATYQSGLPGAVSFEHVTVFSATGNAQSSPASLSASASPVGGATTEGLTPTAPGTCTFQFTQGWYAEERSAAGYHLWMDGLAKMAFTAPADGSYKLSGNLVSIVRPNMIRLLVDGKELGRYNVSTPEGEKLNVPIKVLKGLHLIEFSSSATPINLPNDSRRLAGGLQNASIASKGTPCQR